MNNLKLFELFTPFLLLCFGFFVPFVLSGDSVYWPEDQDLRRTWNHQLFLDHCFETEEGLNERDVDMIKGAIRDLIRRDETGCTNNRRAGFIAAYVRLAWHDAATFDINDGSGGPHACMRLPGNPENLDPDNIGLDGYYTLLKYTHNFFADRISESDMWVLAAQTAIEYGGGPTIPFNYGRSDSWDYETGYADRLPQGYLRKAVQEEELLPHLRSIFSRFGFDNPDRALVALSGAHNLGGIRHFRSGLVPETTDELPWTPLGVYFHNAFYSELLYQRWWDSKSEDPELRVTVKSDNRTFMLHSDQALLYEQHLVDMVEEYAHDRPKWFADFVYYFQHVLEVAYDGKLKKVEPAYLWDIGDWRVCSEWCGQGVQQRDVQCLEYPSGKLSDDGMCEWSRHGGEKPVTSQICNSQLCEEFVWTYSEWSECSSICGGGTKSRNIDCIDLKSQEVVEDSYCESLAAPAILEVCNLDECGYWKAKAGTEGRCDLLCENSNYLKDFPFHTQHWKGSQTSDFECVKEFEGNPRVVGDEWCDEYDKPMYTICLPRFCIDGLPHWQVGFWSECSNECDGGIQTREVSCWAKTPPKHLTLERLPDSACMNPPTWDIPEIQNEYNLPEGVILPEIRPQWSETPPDSQRMCNVRQCLINVKKDVSGNTDGANQQQQQRGDNGISDKKPSKGTSVQPTTETNQKDVKTKNLSDTTDNTDSSYSNFSVIVFGGSFLCFVVFLIAYYVRKTWNKDYNALSSRDHIPLSNISGSDDVGSYQNNDVYD